jgi:hypothetical protein
MMQPTYTQEMSEDTVPCEGCGDYGHERDMETVDLDTGTWEVCAGCYSRVVFDCEPL